MTVCNHILLLLMIHLEVTWHNFEGLRNFQLTSIKFMLQFYILQGKDVRNTRAWKLAMHTCTYTYIHIHTKIYMYVRVYLCVPSACKYLYMCTCVCKYACYRRESKELLMVWCEQLSVMTSCPGDLTCWFIYFLSPLFALSNPSSHGLAYGYFEFGSCSLPLKPKVEKNILTLICGNKLSLVCVLAKHSQTRCMSA